MSNCLLGYEINRTVDNNKLLLFNEIQYELFKMDFNVILDKYDEEYFLGDTFPTNTNNNTITYKLGNKSKNDDKYIIEVIGIDNVTNDSFKGNLVLSFRNNHVYYESLIMNTK